ncbi:MAG: cysteine hydrolase [Euryarchaeota archaeon]|nr:cysteine hydrolase [Euryarchaeota archaeon]
MKAPARPRTALLIVDMQEDIVGMREVTRRTVQPLRSVLDAFRKKGLPVFHIVRTYRRDWSDVELPRVAEFQVRGPRVIENTPGARIVAPLAPREGEHVVVKKRWSGFFMTELPLLLHRLSVGAVVIGGTQTPNCVRSTAFDAVSYDLDTTVLSDGTSAATPQVHQSNLQDMAGIGIRLQTCDEVIERIGKLRG